MEILVGYTGHENIKTIVQFNGVTLDTLNYLQHLLFHSWTPEIFMIDLHTTVVVLQKKRFLKISECSQENNCVGVSS